MLRYHFQEFQTFSIHHLQNSKYMHITNFQCIKPSDCFLVSISESVISSSSFSSSESFSLSSPKTKSYHSHFSKCMSSVWTYIFFSHIIFDDFQQIILYTVCNNFQPFNQNVGILTVSVLRLCVHFNVVRWNKFKIPIGLFPATSTFIGNRMSAFNNSNTCGSLLCFWKNSQDLVTLKNFWNKFAEIQTNLAFGRVFSSCQSHRKRLEIFFVGLWQPGSRPQDFQKRQPFHPASLRITWESWHELKSPSNVQRISPADSHDFVIADALWNHGNNTIISNPWMLLSNVFMIIFENSPHLEAEDCSKS